MLVKKGNMIYRVAAASVDAWMMVLVYLARCFLSWNVFEGIFLGESLARSVLMRIS